ncbi:Beta-glucosidase 1 [Elsinoe australis]|uniref:beta-glucosidase n=1 Tax=Elsinoe australis TaxID=40998 RepID=A0A2P7YMZ3_9PEZI|nr:Beta-glucosidase 1 [Elsinoe australis]
MSDSSLPRDVETILSRLSLEEKASLLSATDWWRTPAIDKKDVFVPHIKTTDGPNGARGESYVSGIKAACFPCGTSIGASFDTQLLHDIGKSIAKEAITKSASVLLAPTLNVIRHPLGGRNYETYSEEPVVLGKLAAAFVEGCQTQNIAATPKHFVANEAENQRKTLSVEGFMTSYNKVNGRYVADDHRQVTQVLRNEWGFKGLVVSDWMGVYSTVDCINAGVDVDLPGPTKWRGKLLVDAVKDGKVQEITTNDSVRRVLDLAKRLGRFEHPEESPEQAVKDAERDEFIATAGAEGMVLLKNDRILPIPMTSSVAVIGHHAIRPSIGGGGSARVDALHVVSPFEGMKTAGFDVRLAPGIPVFGTLPHADPSMVSDLDGHKNKTPVKVEWFNGSVIGQNLVHEENRPNAEYMIKEQWPSYLHKDYCSRMTFTLTSSRSGNHIFSVISTGRAICRINGEEAYVRGQERDLVPDSFYFFKSKIERRFNYHMTGGKTYTIVLESWATPDDIVKAPPLDGRLFQGSAIRFHEEIDVGQSLSDASNLAKQADIAVVFVGTTNEIESEGFDREDMQLPSQQYELIDAVGWYAGQECGDAIARILSGEVNPCGRLPFSWPKKLEDSSAHGNFPAKDNVLRYEEGLDVGCRWHDRAEAPDALFAFGHGLSYTRFEISDVQCHPVMEDGKVQVRCTVNNTGNRFGKLVVQVYVQSPAATIGRKRPVKELKEFVKVGLGPGDAGVVTVTLDKYAVSAYDQSQSCWVARAGRYTVLVGFSCVDIEGKADFNLLETFNWTGL